MSPLKRASRIDENGCDHKDVTTLVAYTNELKYFTKRYLEKNEFWPKKCYECEKLFVDKPAGEIDKDKEYKVTSRSPCYLCKHAANSQHPCCFGLCKPCKIETMGGSPTRRRIKKRLDNAFAMA